MNAQFRKIRAFATDKLKFQFCNLPAAEPEGSYVPFLSLSSHTSVKMEPTTKKRHKDATRTLAQSRCSVLLAPLQFRDY